MIETLERIVSQQEFHMRALKAVKNLGLPDCYIAAGFIRNLVWDHIHYHSTPTPLNDCDVVYFDALEQGDTAHLMYEQRLNQLMPEVKWQVRNQAKMHIRNNDQPYRDTLDAMRHWVELETAVGVKLNEEEQLVFCSVFGWESVFAGLITPNPLRDMAIFEHRVSSKQWLKRWPKLKINK